ncbi:MAG: hypothetical protein V4628_08530 [Pseudomonadota bacterium]
MDEQKLRRAEAVFFQRYPGGFLHPELLAVRKKHKVEQMINLAATSFAKSNFKNTDLIIENVVRVVSRSSMVSVFEKMNFRDFVRALNPVDKKLFAEGLKNFLHGNRQKGFESMLGVLAKGRLAKWSLLTIIPNYFAPQQEVFIKPTTAKGVIAFFGLQGLHYNPFPDWEFYETYRQAILCMRNKVDTTLAPNNAAFCGFLMMSLREY